jgi:hypothetical protein
MLKRQYKEVIVPILEEQDDSRFQYIKRPNNSKVARFSEFWLDLAKRGRYVIFSMMTDVRIPKPGLLLLDGII